MVKKVKVDGVEIELSQESEFDTLIPFSEEEYELIHYNSALLVLYDLQIDSSQEVIPNGIDILCNLLGDDDAPNTQTQVQSNTF